MNVYIYMCVYYAYFLGEGIYLFFVYMFRNRKGGKIPGKNSYSSQTFFSSYCNKVGHQCFLHSILPYKGTKKNMNDLYKHGSGRVLSEKVRGKQKYSLEGTARQLHLAHTQCHVSCHSFLGSYIMKYIASL